MTLTSKKHIAKNTIFLYLRMIVVIIANFITIRVIWNALGIEDYGIYNVVAGFVLMFDFMRSGMVAAAQRYFAYGIGLKSQDILSKYFNISLSTFIIIGILIILIGEAVGIWFINSKMNIPENRMFAANVVFQLSLISFFISIVIVPYNACIVAHEDMNIYGYLGIIEALLKLSIAYIIYYITFDKLIIYAILQLFLYLIINFGTLLYCKNRYSECNKFNSTSDKELSKQIFSFASWSVIGNLGFSLRDQGLNLVINIYFNVLMNAAKAIGNQVSIAIRGFTSNFQMAMNPQIVKNYAANNTNDVINLIMIGSKFSFFLLLIIVIPLFIKSEYVLTIWLKDINIYMVNFLKLSLVLALIESFSGPITTGLQATGNIKKFQITISIIMISTIIISTMWIHINRNPYIVMWSAIITSSFGVAARLYLLNEQIPIKYSQFLSNVFLPSIIVMIIGAISVYFMSHVFYNSITSLISFSICSTIILLTIIYLIGLNKNERTIIQHSISTKLSKFPILRKK